MLLRSIKFLNSNSYNLIRTPQNLINIHYTLISKTYILRYLQPKHADKYNYINNKETNERRSDHRFQGRDLIHSGSLQRADQGAGSHTLEHPARHQHLHDKGQLLRETSPAEEDDTQTGKQSRGPHCGWRRSDQGSCKGNRRILNSIMRVVVIEC